LSGGQVAKAVYWRSEEHCQWEIWDVTKPGMFEFLGRARLAEEIEGEVAPYLAGVASQA
jgi:hypothetical protein